MRAKSRPEFDKTYVIAEMACSHEGDTKLARKIIDGAGQAGAQAIQFQIWTHTEVVVPHHNDFPVMQKLQFSHDDWLGLRDHVRENYPDMHIIACVYEPGSTKFANEFGADAFKLHSADLSNPVMLQCVAETGKRIDLSVGGSTIAEIQTAIETINNAGNRDIWLMYGLQLFPTTPDVVHLKYMMKLRELFELPIGYQDHTDGGEPGAFHLPAAAMGLGVEILEKHITHDRSFKGIDHQAALNPDEFGDFTTMVREIDRAMGVPIPRPFSEAEEKYRIYSKKSIVAAHDIPAGAKVSQDDIRFMRSPDMGLPPDRCNLVLGRETKAAIPAYALVGEDDLV